MGCAKRIISWTLGILMLLVTVNCLHLKTSAQRTVSTKETCDRSNTCKNGGTCQEVGKSKFCKCMEGTEGDFCETVTGCGALDCGSEAECKFIIADKKSVCVSKIPGFGYNSSYTQRKQTCGLTYPCKNGGRCPTTGNLRFCECLEGTEGDLCETATECAYLECGSEAVCKFIIADKKSVCVCKKPGFAYDFFEKKCKKTCDETYTCKNGGTCPGSGNSKFCKCVEGTEGDLCETATGCATLERGSADVCKFLIVDKKIVYVCKTPGFAYDSWDKKCKKCDCGYHGKCEFVNGNKTCFCPPGLIEIGGECQNPCTKMPCLNGGTCFVEGNSFRCSCLPSFTGKTCDYNYG